MRTPSCCAASWNLAGLQDEVRGLSETVQRLASENETLRSQTTVGAVRTVTMANEVARLNKPTAFSRAEEEYSDWEFVLPCFVGTMDGTLLTELRAVAANPRVNRVPTDEAGNERARALYNILALLTTKGPRKMVREVPDQNGYEAYRSLVLRYGSRDAHGETAILIMVMNFIFGDIDAMETKFDEFNLLIKKDDDISGVDNIPDTIKRAVLVARAPEPLRTHFQLTSQSYTTFFEMRQAINQHLKARKGFKLMERDDPMDVDFVHKEGQKGKEKGNDKGKGKPESIGKDSRIKKSSKAHAGIVARQDTSGANVGRKAVERRNKRTMSVRRRKLVT